VLGERELQSGCASRFSIFKDVAGNPSIRKERCPGTPCVPARRDGHYHKGAIESSPLQTYASALLFSPTGSLVRKLYKHEEPAWVAVKPAMGDNWSACLQTLEGHSSYVNSVAFSRDSTKLASASHDKTVKVWDASSGACLHTLEGHSRKVTSVAFSHDSTKLASASNDKTVKVWDASSRACLHTLEGHSDGVNSVAFSHDSTTLASASYDTTVKVWDASSGACLQTFEGHSSSVNSVAFSHDSTKLASASDDRTVKLWDASSGACLHTLEGHSRKVTSVAFSHDSTKLASASDDRTVKLWDASSGACLHTLEGHSSSVSSVAFLRDSTKLASASYDNTVKVWDASSSACLQTPEGHSDDINSVVFSHDSTKLASASYDNTVKVWDVSSGECLQTLEGHTDAVRLVAFSHNMAWLASASWDQVVKIWDVKSGVCFQTLNVGTTIDRISFDKFDSFLRTNIGVIDITIPPAYSLPQSAAEPPNLQDRSLALSADGIWITYDSHHLVWLPSEYRPSCSAVSGMTIGVGVGTGRIWSCNVQLDATRRRQEDIKDTVPVLEKGRTTKEPLQTIRHTVKPTLFEERTQERSQQLGTQSLQTERTEPCSEFDEDSTYGGTTTGGDESIFTRQTLIESSVSETDIDQPCGIFFPENTMDNNDIRSIISEDDNLSQISISNAGRIREIENAVVSLLASNSILIPVYKEALELMTKERFANNFGRILKAFHVDLKRFEGNVVMQELAAILWSKEVRKRIARKITDRFVSHQDSLSERDLPRVHGSDGTDLSYLEAWLTKSNVSPLLHEDAPGQPESDMQEEEIMNDEAKIATKLDVEDGSSDIFDSEGEEGQDYPTNMDLVRFPRLDLVMQSLVEGQPFRDMVARLREFLLPTGLLRDIFPIPGESITYNSDGSHGVWSAVQALLENLTELEWDWWPLPPRMNPLGEGHTRVFWRCVRTPCSCISIVLTSTALWKSSLAKIKTCTKAHSRGYPEGTSWDIPTCTLLHFDAKDSD
jgi:WD40 repeat protein